MKIQLLKQWSRTEADGFMHLHNPGEIVSVLHITGRDLIYGRMALWVESEAGDPDWKPPIESLCAKRVEPKENRMMRAAVNR